MLKVVRAFIAFLAILMVLPAPISIAQQGATVVQGLVTTVGPTYVANQTRPLSVSTSGNLRVMNFADTGNWAYAAATTGIVNTATAVTMKTAAGAGIRNVVYSCQVAHDLLSAVTELAIRDGAGGTVIWRTKLQTPAVDASTYNFSQPLIGTANLLVEVVTLTAVTGGVYVNCQGMQTR